MSEANQSQEKQRQGIYYLRKLMQSYHCVCGFIGEYLRGLYRIKKVYIKIYKRIAYYLSETHMISLDFRWNKMFFIHLR